MTKIENQIPVEQLSQLLKQAIPAFAATIVVLIYIIYKIPAGVDSFWLAIWAGTIIVINIYLLIWIYLAQHTSINAINAKKFIFAYQIEAVCHGLAWSILPFLLASSSSSSETQFFAYIVLCGMAAGAIGTTAMIFHIYLSFMLPMMLPGIFTQLFLSNSILLFSQNTVEFLVIFVISLIVLSHTYYESALRSITLMLENQELLFKATDAYEKAEAANHAKSQFLANMSHELRTPLNAVIGYSEIIYEHAKEHGIDSVSDDAEKITRAGKHLLSLINNVLDLSKIEAGKMEVYIEDIDINMLLGDIQMTTETLIKKNQNKLIYDVPDNLGNIHSDYTKLRQILFNIIGNAAKFTSHGKVIISAVKNLTTETISISVSDTGIGMTNEQLKDLTTPFVQADVSTTRTHGGTGLGMSLTNHLTKLLNIGFHVNSTLNQGTRFDLVIPVDITKIKKGS